MKPNHHRSKDIDTTRDALASWRRLHGGRGRPIPAALWSDAAALARTNGIAETARALHLDRRRLARFTEEVSPPWSPRRGAAPAEPAAFVELDAIGWGERREPAGAVVELSSRDGDRVRVELGGVDAGIDRLVAVVRAFWERRT